ncbi:acyltransferase [uncultured Pseudokineococcus sp.]|uniref:acyltransferase family protein n=1 Tax=uncultured Pseudokineococcus sp. TaxID=1642928 RepID=UPI002612C262|nr:acyltransferase [uncultured Pseudokineococcus sp.]
MRARSANVDGLRVLALVAIVVGHVYTESEPAERLVQSWRLPLFFVLAGYFWRPGLAWVSDLSGRWRSTAVPYLAWLAVLTAVALPASEDPVDRLVEALLGGSYALRPLTTFWFLSCLFFAALLYRALERVPPAVRAALCLAGLVVNVLAGELLARVPLSAGTALGAVALLWCGDELRRRALDRPALTRRRAAWALLLPPVVLLAVVDDFTPLDMEDGELPVLAVVVALLLSCGFVVLADAAPAPPARVAAAYRALTRPAVVVVLVHPLVLAVLPPDSALLPSPVVAALAFVLPLVLGLGLAGTRAAPLLLGRPSTGRLGAGPAQAPRPDGRPALAAEASAGALADGTPDDGGPPDRHRPREARPPAEG